MDKRLSEDELYIRGMRVGRGIPENSYLYDLPVVKTMWAKRELSFRNPVTFFVGENGVGKSTLIEALAISAKFNPEGGSVNMNFSTKKTHSELYRHLTLIRGASRPRDGFFLRAESFYNLATDVERLDTVVPGMFLNYGGISLHEQSHGESFLALVENRFYGKGLYILDEPEAALSPKGIMRLMVNVNRLTETGSQFIISTHSPILMSLPNADIYEITEDEIRLTEYTQTEHYVLTKRFLDTPEKMLKVLLGENK